MARIRPRTQVRSGPSTVSGSAIAPILTSGAPKAQASVVDGAGARILTSSGAPQAQDSVVSGGVATIAIPAITFPQSLSEQYHDLSSYYTIASDYEYVSLQSIGNALPSGVTLDSANQRLVCAAGAGEVSATGVQLRLTYQLTAAADWQARISGAGVKWYHDFSVDGEITQFLWASGYGDDPARTQTKSQWVTRQTADGITGGACLEILRPTGSTDPAAWARPLAALQENGRGESDPGWSSGMPTTAPIQGNGTRLNSWQNTDAGRYGHPNEGSWTGNEFYIQMRVKVDPRRVVQTVSGSDGGKIAYITTGDGRVVAQELVSYYDQNVNFAIYQGSGFSDIPNDLGPDDPLYPDEWVTYLYHIIPGTEYEGLVDDGSDVPTQIYVDRARAGETSYTRIFEKASLALDYQNSGPFAFNLFNLNNYHNGASMTDFWVRYDQIIFSTDPIPCPQV